MRRRRRSSESIPRCHFCTRELGAALRSKFPSTSVRRDIAMSFLMSVVKLDADDRKGSSMTRARTLLPDAGPLPDLSLFTFTAWL